MKIADADAKVIDLFDRRAAWAQRRGANLLAIKLVVQIAAPTLMLVQLMISPINVWLRAFFLVVLSLTMWSVLTRRLNELKANRDYPEVARRVLALNALAILERDKWRWRTGYFLVCLPPLLFVNPTQVADVLFVVVVVLLEAGYYLDCCFFLGPGEHSKQKREAAAGRRAFQN